MPHPVAAAVGHVRIMLVMAALPSPLALPIVVVCERRVGGVCSGAAKAAKVLVLAFIGTGPVGPVVPVGAVVPVFVFFNLLHGESDVN